MTSYISDETLRTLLAGIILAGRMAGGAWQCTEAFIDNETDVAVRMTDALLVRLDKRDDS